MSRLATISISLIALTIIGTGCDPRQLPGMKERGKREEERITRETEEAIKRSIDLQELDRLCTQVIPRPQLFVPVNKFRTFNGPPLLGYGYHSALDYQSVKVFYANYFVPPTWKLVSEKDGGWGPSRIDFKNDKYRVRVSESGYRGEGINYFVECARLQ